MSIFILTAIVLAVMLGGWFFYYRPERKREKILESEITQLIETD